MGRRLGSGTRGRGPIAVAGLLVCVHLGLASVLVGTAHAQVKGTIVGPGDLAFPIAVAPLATSAPNAELGVRFAETIRRDLDFTGMFRMVADDAVATRSTETGVTAEDVDFAAWAGLGVRLLVKGRYSLRDGDLDLEVRLFDVLEKRALGGKRYQGEKREATRMAHRFADEILNLLTGEPGPFDSRIAFVSTRGGRFKELYFTTFDARDLQQLTRNRTINLSPSWAPDARRLLFTSFQSGHPELFEIDVLNDRERQLTRGSGLTIGGRWAPDGGSIAATQENASGNSDVVILDSSGAVRRKLASSDAIDVSPSWSPDGNSVAFCSSRSGGPQIFVMDASGGSARRVSFSGSYNTSPAWSPKGDKIAYTGRSGGRFQIFVVPASGGEAQQLTASAGDNLDPAWSPDGRFLMFSSSRSGRPQLWVMTARGENQKPFTAAPGGDTSPAWSRRLDGGGDQ